MKLGHQIERGNTENNINISIHTCSTNLKSHIVFVNLGLLIRNTQLIVMHQCPQVCSFNASMTHQQQIKQQHTNNQQNNQQICLDR
jgi:hypothetical protein